MGTIANADTNIVPRSSRLVLPDVVHHAVARGVNRQRLFEKGSDKRKYLKRFGQMAEQEQVIVHGYCLMDNHVHWLLTPRQPDGLARLFRRVHTWWAMVYNRRYDRSGHLFQNRFSSSPLTENHYWTALRYVEVNPRRAKLVDKAEDWEFSSAKAHLHGTDDPLIKISREQWRRRFTGAQWREFLEHTDAERERGLRQAQPGCRPVGSSQWIRQLEQQWNRKLAWSPPGRPPKLAVQTGTATRPNQ